MEQERRLVEQAQLGDLDALRPLLERYADPLYATVLLPRLGDAAAAGEVLRDTLATAVEKIDGFRWQGRGVYPWLRQIAINKTHDRHRLGQRSRRLAASLAQELPSETAPEDAPDARLIAEEERQLARVRIDAALAAIAPRYRQALELRLFEELPREECARRLDVTVATFDVVLYRAVRAFRRHFGQR
jgi:RNA polymerase sigma-70 factor (ECF subfamily)